MTKGFLFLTVVVLNIGQAFAKEDQTTLKLNESLQILHQAQQNKLPKAQIEFPAAGGVGEKVYNELVKSGISYPYLVEQKDYATALTVIQKYVTTDFSAKTPAGLPTSPETTLQASSSGKVKVQGPATQLVRKPKTTNRTIASVGAISGAPSPQKTASYKKPLKAMSPSR